MPIWKLFKRLMSVNFYPRPGQSQPVSMFDADQLAQLRRGVSENQGGTQDQQRQVAEQFEALFIQQLLKQARAVASGNGLFDSQQVQMAQSMGDEQLALQLSNPGMGLADALMEQMRRNQGDATVALPTRSDPDVNTSRLPELQSHLGEKARIIDAPTISALINKLTGPVGLDQVYSAIRGAPAHVREFVSKMRDAATEVAANTGLPAQLILSQAALESGWGKREIKHDNGQTSHNLFGIKAGKSWSGKVVNVMTTEFENGKAQKLSQPFRAYDSYTDSFLDYAKLVSNSPRYESVLRASTPQEAAQRIQEAGYATDPSYAQKLISIMSYFDSTPR